MEINLKDNKTFCAFGFKGAMIEVDGRVRPCCRFKIKKSQRLKVNEDRSITDIFNSELYKDIRKKMLAGEKVDGCQRCYREEEAGYLSMRLSDIIQSTNTDVELQYLEFESGRHCNLKCRSCSADVSTKWNEDIKRLPSLQDPDFDYEAHYYNEALEKLSKDECSKLRSIKVTGGEPFLSKTFLTFMNNMVEWDYAKNVTLKVYTNTSFLPKKKFLNQLLKFRNLYLYMSIDDIKERNDYLRSGSEWKLVELVARYWMELASKEKKVHLVVSNTVSIFNLLTLNEFDEWLKQKEKEYNIFIECNYQPLHYPTELAYYNWPRHIKNQMKESLARYKNPSNKIKRLYDLLDSHKVTTISVKKQFLSTTNSIDYVRNESWKQVFPELFKLLNG